MSNIVILGDTNVAYNLYFFISQGVIPSKNIIIGSDAFKFHPIVLIEVEAHAQAWIVSQELAYKDENLPSFFNFIQREGILKICKFVEDNLATIELVDSDTEAFAAKRKIYERVRVELQDEMKLKGYKGKKVNSKPSLNDYKILYSAEVHNMKISTNDGILLDISKEVLDLENAFNTESILKMILTLDCSKKKNIEEALKTLEYFERNLNNSEIFI